MMQHNTSSTSTIVNNSILSHFYKSFQDGFQVLPPKGHITLHQKALFLVWVSSMLLWLYRLATKQMPWRSKHPTEIKPATEIITDTPTIINVVLQADASKPTTTMMTRAATTTATTTPNSRITLDHALSAICILGWIMLYYFICDFIHYFPKSERIYNRDLFMFLSLILFFGAICFTTVESKDGKLLSRDQTEEWKGWMQVMFVWYHYFRAAETYNAVRIYIAAYVWMTGFGNFSFFWLRKDYSLRRMLKTLFRLNFLVCMTCVIVDNPYMLYYICAMHTFWYFTVYAMMRPFHHLNHNPKVMFLKFTIYFTLLTLLYQVPELSSTVFAPFSFILSYDSSLHEWLFRSKLDHYATFIGMLCAYFHPNVEATLKRMNQHRMEKMMIASVCFVLLCVSFVWRNEVFVLTKYEYNALHPYTSWIPILTYIYLRNCTAWLRRRYVALLSFLGKITLETYISQLHIYLQANAKAIIVYIPEYPLMNFMVNSVIYLYMAKLLFDATVTLNEFIFPADKRKMLTNILTIVCIIATSYLINFGLKLL